MRSGGTKRIRRALGRPASVATELEVTMWLALPDIALGATWAFVHARPRA